MAERKPGEVVSVVSEQVDSEGFKISQVKVEWYGQDNTTANIMSMGLISAVQAEAAKWQQAKASGQDLVGKPRPQNRA